MRSDTPTGPNETLARPTRAATPGIHPHRGDIGHLDITTCAHQDDIMRTTLTLEADVAARLELEMRRSGEGMKAVVNRALRLGLGLTDKPERPTPFEVESHSFGFGPGTDLDRLNQLADELEAEEAAKKLRP